MKRKFEQLFLIKVNFFLKIALSLITSHMHCYISHLNVKVFLYELLTNDVMFGLMTIFFSTGNNDIANLSV